jgi:hypothetical protein
MVGCKEGRKRYPQSNHILILADTGGSNRAQRAAWKQQIQESHRASSVQSDRRNWVAESLDSYEKALKFIGATTTTGLKVARLDTTYYPTCVKPSKVT